MALLFPSALYTSAGLMNKTVKLTHPRMWIKTKLVMSQLGVWSEGVQLEDPVPIIMQEADCMP